MDVELGEVAAANDGVLRRADLDATGLTPRAIAALVETGTLVRVHRDLYRLPVADEHPLASFHATVRAQRHRDGQKVLTGPAALSVLGLPVFGNPGTVHVAANGATGSSRRSVTSTVAALPGDQITTVRGCRTASPARAVLDTARLQSVVAGVVAADHALRGGLMTRDELERALGAMVGLPGITRARLCCRLASPLSESPGESWSAVAMHQHRVVPPERQETVADDAGTIGRVDFWWPEQGVVGEFDGRVKYGRANPSGRPPEDVLWHEKLREDRLRALGLGVVRWTTADLYRPSRWIGRLRGLSL